MRAAVVSVIASGLVVSAAAQDRGTAAPLRVPSPFEIVHAIESTLARHPLLEAQRQQVVISEALRRQQAGAFDTQAEWTASGQHQRTPLTDAERTGALAAGFPASALTENIFGMSGSAQRLLRSGIVLGPTFAVSRLTDNLQTLDGLNRARLSFDVTVPLLRGRGTAIVTGPETAASMAVVASRYELGQQAADLVLGTATSYWQYVGAVRQLEIATQSEARGREYVEAVRTLADADRLPRSEVNQAQANFDSRAAGRFLLEQQVVEARSALALAMGLDADQMAALPVPSDPFPDGPGPVPPSGEPGALQVLVDLALTRRGDYLAAESNRAAADVLRQVAANRVRAQLDVTVSGGYSSLQAGRGTGDFLGSLFTQVSGPDALLALRWARPLANNTARGEMAQAEATYQQAVWLRTERARVIATEVANAVSALRNGAGRLARAIEATTGFRAALEGESDKLRLGVGSLTDLLTVEGRLTEALLDLVSAQQAYAAGLVQLRYATGTLIDVGDIRVPSRDTFFRPLGAGAAHP